MVQYALITGCSEGGIGEALCQEFQKQSVHVFVTARNVAKISNGLRNLPNITTIALDVTKADSIATAKQVVEKITHGRLDYLVNNSGVNYVAPLLDLDIQLGRDMYEVNVWGAVAMIQSFAPLLVASKGTICNIGSICGIGPSPWMSESDFTLPEQGLPLDLESDFVGCLTTSTGIYNGSKAAIGMIGETLRLELAPFDVKVITCITGAINTKIMEKSWKAELPADSLYGAASIEIEERATGKEKVGRMEPQQFAQKLVHDCMTGVSGKVFRGKYSSTFGIVSSHLPTSVVDSMVSSNAGIEKLRSPNKA